jgi:hypothetical protein
MVKPTRQPRTHDDTAPAHSIRNASGAAEAKFLCVKSNGTYARLTDGELSRPRSAKAALRPNSSERQRTRRAAS